MRRALRITHYGLRITHYALRITHYAGASITTDIGGSTSSIDCG